MAIDKRVDAWRSAGLIDDATAAAILAHEKRNDRPLALYALSGIGALAIGIGLIAIVASNWANIPASAKLIADGLLGTALAASIYRFFHSEGWVRDTLILVFYFFVLASMGLIGQIYQTGTPLHEALLFWSVITAPIMLFTRSHFAASTWLLGLLGTYVANAVDFLDNFNRDDTIDFVLVLVFVVPVVLIALGLSQPLQKRAPSVALTFEHAGLALIGLIGVFSQFWWYATPDEKLASWGGMTVIALGAVGALLYDDDKKSRLGEMVVVWICALCWALPTMFAHASISWLGALQCIGFLAVVAWASLRAGWHRVFALATAGIGLRIIFAYFEVFGSLMNTGLGLIIGGALTLLLAWLWTRVTKASASKGAAE